MNANKKSKTKLNWWTITNIYRKETVIFYLLTTLSCLSSFLISRNSFSAVYNALKEGKDPYQFKWDIGFKNFGEWQFGDNWKKFLLVMGIFIIIYCAIVVAHVYYGYYFANKITTATKKKTIRKLFRLQNLQAKKKSLSVLTHNIRTFASLVVYVPNQLYYWLLGVSLTFYSAFKYREEVGGAMIWLGVGFFLLCTAIIIIFQYLHYKKDLEFQKPLEKETEKEEFLVNHRDLIIKKSLTAEYEKNYARSLEKSHTAENKRDWIFTLSFVVPSYSLPKFAPFFLFLFVKNNPSKPVFNTANSLIGLADDTKKMAERLRIYPFGLSAQKQINDFLAEPERDDIQKNVLVSEPVENITLQKVSFAYQKSKSVLKKVDWEFRRGQVNHLTGENGFGKSTIISLIMGLYQPNQGQILINNKYKLNEINLIAWRKKIAYAEHENLVENGLSTGQKQRADLNSLLATSENKEIFIFDEADNALDEKNKKEFRQKIEKISKKKLVILINH
ncbi:putative Xenobiotic-transporting ATPase [endosymbiont DhMRE of Dentiscutata heterogama]|nr:putative Xenobiotic-transporting ATPase [endosymbiont DhMRE of Dentiscutata heterogama]